MPVNDTIASINHCLLVDQNVFGLSLSDLYLGLQFCWIRHPRQVVADPAAVPDAVAAVLGIVQQPGSSLAASVAAALEGRTRLLVFDNCEHVLDAAADIIEAILAASSTVKVIATSREGLRATEEQLWPVHSLDVRSSATTLFVERASAVAPEVSLEEADAIIEICRRLDGIPLAIELAASRMQSMTSSKKWLWRADIFRSSLSSATKSLRV